MASLPPTVPERMHGRLFAHTTADLLPIAVSATRADSGSGLVIRAPAATTARALQDAGYPQPIIYDAGHWASCAATVGRPMALSEDGGLFSISLDEWASAILTNGFDAVLTPSLFAPARQPEVLRAVIAAGNGVMDPRVITLVCTDAAMLDAGNLPVLLAALRLSVQPVAVVFAASSRPIARRGRARALRQLFEALPGSMVLGTEPIVATDSLAHGAAACAIGVTGALRRPKRPGDSAGGNRAAQGVPGLFLRQLWEHRSPGVYADWYGDRPSPRCGLCGGRALDTFDNSDEDKLAVLDHNIHAWLHVLEEMRGRSPAERASWLAADRLEAFNRQIQLRPAEVSTDADPVLRQLVALDGLATDSVPGVHQWH